MKRRGFDHWLGAFPLEQAANEEFLDGIYPSLRMGDEVAKSLVVRRHMRLAFAVCCRYAQTYSDSDELVSEALLTLVRGVEMISKGALDKHKPKPNVSGYLSRSVTGRLNDLINRTTKRLKKEKPESRLTLSATKDYLSRLMSPLSEPIVILQYRELLALVFNSVKTDRDKKLVSMKLAGHTSKEVGAALGITDARVDQIWWKVRENVEGK